MSHVPSKKSTPPDQVVGQLSRPRFMARVSSRVRGSSTLDLRKIPVDQGPRLERWKRLGCRVRRQWSTRHLLRSNEQMTTWNLCFLSPSPHPLLLPLDPLSSPSTVSSFNCITKSGTTLPGAKLKLLNSNLARAALQSVPIQHSYFRTAMNAAESDIEWLSDHLPSVAQGSDCLHVRVSMQVSTFAITLTTWSREEAV
jgi:hypothetical protein